jgi:hypothetical protein
MARGELCRRPANVAPGHRRVAGKFQQSVLHTLITGLLDRTACADQVSWESYHHPGGDFDLCTGPHLQLFSDAEGPGLRGALDRMLGALRQTALARKIHWLRIFTCHDHRRLTTNEVLLDGEPWPAGESIMASLTPPTTSDLTGVRLFALLIPRQPDQGAALAIPRTQRITYPGGVRARERARTARGRTLERSCGRTTLPHSGARGAWSVVSGAAQVGGPGGVWTLI